MEKSFLKKIFSANPMAENKEGEKTDMAFIVFNEYALNLEDVNYNGDQVYYEVEFAFSNI